MEVENIEPWLFTIEPFEGESISHFLGRFRRENDLTVSGLGREMGIGGACRKADHCVIARWESLDLIILPRSRNWKNYQG